MDSEAGTADADGLSEVNSSTRRSWEGVWTTVLVNELGQPGLVYEVFSSAVMDRLPDLAGLLPTDDTTL